MAAKRSADKQSQSVRPAVNLTANGLAVLKARYLMKGPDGEIIETPEELFWRVAGAVSAAEKAYGLSDGAVDTIRDEFYRMMAVGEFMPNSPTLMNAGRSHGLLSACFVLPVDDSIDSIFSAIHNTALIQKAGGGTGFSFSRLRPKGDMVSSSGGTTSGPLSFMRVFSSATNAIQQGAFRRGANMGMLRVDHPDIVDFIHVKENLKELTNFNLSVAATDDFMASVKNDPKKEHVVRNPRTGETATLKKEDGTAWTVGELFDLIVEKAWKSGEPGVIYIDTANKANRTPHVGTIEATNPCGEQPLLPYESCNLGSINLTKFIRNTPDGTKFDFEALKNTVHLSTRFLDNIIDINRYPVDDIEKITKGNRKIGLGLMGFADCLYELGIPYDSEAGIEFGEKVMKFLNDESHAASRKLAVDRGVFPYWKGSTWEQEGIKIRNACTTTVAPTGTISIIADCTSGIEPLFSLVFYRNVLDGQRLTEINSNFENVAKQGGFYSAELVDKIAKEGTIKHMEGIPEQVRKVFVTAHDIAPDWHVRMQAAFQKHCDSAISKTVNFTQEAKQDDIRNILLMAHEAGCKGVTVYRNGCRENQPMELAKQSGGTDAAQKDAGSSRSPVRLPDIMPAVRIKQITPFGNMHVKIVVDPKTSKDLEVFAQLGKGGELATSDLEAICRLISLYLRINGSIEDVLGQLEGIGSSLTIPTKDGRIASLADGLATAIRKYLDAKKKFGIEAILLCKCDMAEYERGLKSMGIEKNGRSPVATVTDYKIRCPECKDGVLILEEGCSKCHSCGYTMC